MDSPSGLDEGEIIESDLEKATTSLPSASGTHVDRPSRTSVAAPTSSEAADHVRQASPSNGQRSRLEKRRRDDDHSLHRHVSDRRQFKVHYEDRPSRQARTPLSYADLDRAESPPAGQRNDQWRVSRPQAKRPRTRSRSRSPPRQHRPIDHRPAAWDDRRASHSGRTRLEANRNGHSSRHEPASQADARTSGWSGDGYPSSEAGPVRDDSKAGRPVVGGAVPSISSNSDVAPVAADAEPVDQATLIEERRKRREAIKAKYREQATPLPVQSLQVGDHAATSATNATSGPPDVDSASRLPSSSTGHMAAVSATSPHDSPPDTPKLRTGTNSPMALSVAKDQNPRVGSPSTPADGEDGPSAADYDPTMDMREDRMRDNQRHHEEEIASGAYDETHDRKGVNEVPGDGAPSKDAAPDGEFDMFAEDADDMFAQSQSPSGPSKVDGDAAAKGTKVGAAKVSRAKELDMSMLDNWDDPEGYYRIILGELLDGRYHVQTNLGKGMFSGVVRAMDSKTGRVVAIKMIRNNETMRKAGLREIEILQKLAAADVEDKKHLIRLERSFDHKGHLCMVFENLSINLREVLKKFGRDVGINLRAVRAYAQQMFLGLSLLRKCNILHADLKPDNVLVNESRNMLKICDLGSASDASENEITPYLVSRFYRAPEIILGIPYDFAIDIWSVGCTLYELYTGKILFTGRTNNQMLRSIMECRGKFGHKMLRRAQFAPMHFDDLLNFRSVERDKLSGKDVIRMINLTKPTRDLKARLLSTSKDMDESELKDLHQFIDLLDRCLHLNPEKRCTPTEALRHPFILRVKS